MNADSFDTDRLTNGAPLSTRVLMAAIVQVCVIVGLALLGATTKVRVTLESDWRWWAGLVVVLMILLVTLSRLAAQTAYAQQRPEPRAIVGALVSSAFLHGLRCSLEFP